MSDPFDLVRLVPGLLLAADEATSATELVQIPDSARRLLMVVLGAYLLVLFGLSIFATKQVKNEEDYLVAGRKLPLFLAWGTLIATWFGAATMTGAAEAARDEGLLGVILDPFACSATLILAGLFFAKPLWRLKLLTVSDLFRRCYGSSTELVAGIVQVVGYFGWIAAQYVALGAVQHAYFGVPMQWAIFIGMAVTLVYTMIGGMWSVTLTDTAQIVLAFVGLLVLAFSTLSTLGGGEWTNGWDRLFAEVDEGHFRFVPVAGVAAYLAYGGTWATGLFGNIPGQDLQQRIFSAKSPRTAMWACLLAGVIYLLFGMIPVGLGLASTLTDPGEQEGKILQLMAGKYLSPTMAVVFIVSFVSIVVSTATSAVLAPATILGHNILGRIPVLQGRGLLVDRVCVLLISLGGLALAYSGESIMGLLDLSLSIALVALFVPLFMALYGSPRGHLPGFLAVAFGIMAFLPRWGLEQIFLPMDEQGFVDYEVFLSFKFSDYPVLAALYAIVPADLQGLLGSFVGYFAGQWWCRHHPAVNGEIRREAFDSRHDDVRAAVWSAEHKEAPAPVAAES